MTQYPRRNQHGELVPFLSDYMRGMLAIQAQGLVKPKDMAMVARPGHVLADLDPLPASKDPATLAALAQVQARNVATLAELDQIQAREHRRREMERELGLDRGRPPDSGTPDTPNLANGSDRTGAGSGGDGPASAEQVGDSVPFDPIKQYLANTRDEDDDRWTPS